MATEFERIKESLGKAKLASFLLIPLKYDSDTFNGSWLAENAVRTPFTTMDINESIKQTINAENTTYVISRYNISKETVFKNLGLPLEELSFYACEKDSKCFDVRHYFELCDAEIYVFHTQVAFLIVKIKYSKMSLLDTICNLGSAENNVEYYYAGGDGTPIRFDFEGGLIRMCAQSNIVPFFKSDCSIFLEGYVYTTAVVEKRFEELDTMRQIVFNLHLMVDLDTLCEDDAEEDVNYVYAVKNQTLATYRWGCCITSQTISYIVANSAMDIDSEMADQAENGLPVVLLALYQKYTCLRFRELLSIVDKKKLKRLKQLKRQMLDFQAFGTIATANISRWHNIKQIYKHVLDTNSIPEAVDNINVTLGVLAEHQDAIQASRNNTIMGLITIFGIVSIPSSIISIIDIMTGGNPLNRLTTVVSLLSMVMMIIVMLLYRKKD